MEPVSKCPKCGFEPVEGPECPRCGVVFAKLVSAEPQEQVGAASGITPRLEAPAAASGRSPWLVPLGLVLVGIIAAARMDWGESAEVDAGETFAARPAPAPDVSAAPPARSGPSIDELLAAEVVVSQPVEEAQRAEEPEPAPAAEPPTGPVYTDRRWYSGAGGYRQAADIARDRRAPMAVYFYTDWCGYCRELESKLLSTHDVDRGLEIMVKVRVNPEHGPDERAVAEAYGVRGYPSFFVHRPGGRGSPSKISRVRGGRLKTPAEFVSSCYDAAGI